MLLVWLSMLLIAVGEIPRLVAKEQRREFYAFITLWATATLYASLIAAEIKLPTPTEFFLSLFGGY